MMIKAPHFVIFMFGVAVLSACGGTPAKSYYSLANNTVTTPNNTNVASCSLPLVIASVSAAASYDNDKIAYRTKPYEINYYNYRFWTAPPEDMLMDLLHSRLGSSGLFSSVDYRFNSRGENLSLYVKIDTIEERDSDDQWYARLAMNFVLKGPDEAQVVWQYKFDREQISKEQSVLGIVATLSDIYNTEMNAVVVSLSSFLASYAGCSVSTQNSED